MARKNPTALDMPAVDKHDQMCDEMHGALYSLSERIRKPVSRNGEKLLPEHLKEGERPGARQAKKHIERLHRAFKKQR